MNLFAIKFGVLEQVCYLIVSIPDSCAFFLTFKNVLLISYQICEQNNYIRASKLNCPGKA